MDGKEAGGRSVSVVNSACDSVHDRRWFHSLPYLLHPPQSALVVIVASGGRRTLEPTICSAAWRCHRQRQCRLKTGRALRGEELSMVQCLCPCLAPSVRQVSTPLVIIERTLSDCPMLWDTLRQRQDQVRGEGLTLRRRRQRVQEPAVPKLVHFGVVSPLGFLPRHLFYPARQSHCRLPRSKTSWLIECSWC
jgi:hypothetical protein